MYTAHFLPIFFARAPVALAQRRRRRVEPRAVGRLGRRADVAGNAPRRRQELQGERPGAN